MRLLLTSSDSNELAGHRLVDFDRNVNSGGQRFGIRVGRESKYPTVFGLGLVEFVKVTAIIRQDAAPQRRGSREYHFIVDAPIGAAVLKCG